MGLKPDLSFRDLEIGDLFVIERKGDAHVSTLYQKMTEERVYDFHNSNHFIIRIENQSTTPVRKVLIQKRLIRKLYW